MASFPSLTYPPDPGSWQETVLEDPTLRGRSEGGYTVTRSRFTAVKKKWKIKYPIVTDDDKDTLESFENTTVYYGTESFTWYNHHTQTNYTVRFLTPIEFAKIPGKKYLWSAEFEIGEA